MAGFGAALMAAFAGRLGEAQPASKAVSVAARVGEIFPPVALLQQISRTGHEMTAFGSVWQRTQREPEILDFAVFPEAAVKTAAGPLTPSDYVALNVMIRRFLIREFGYAPRSIEFIGPPGFWYPFTDRSAICGRLFVTPL